jgi:FAD binding domain-containing protein
MTTITPNVASLAALEERLKRGFSWLELPAKSWMPRRVVNGESVVDVVIVGAGMAGLVASAILKRLGVDNHLVLDRARAGEEGPFSASRSAQNSSGALSTTSFITKKVRVWRTPGSAMSCSPWMRLKSSMSPTRIFRK